MSDFLLLRLSISKQCRKNRWAVSYPVKWKSSLVKMQTRKMLPPWNDIPVSGGERKMAKHIYRKHEGVVTVYEPLLQTAYKQQHGNVPLCTSPLFLLPSLPFPSYSLLFLFVPSVKIVKASLVLTAAPGRRSAISGWRKSSPTTGKRSDTLSAQDVFFLSAHLPICDGIITRIKCLYRDKIFSIHLITDK